MNKESVERGTAAKAVVITHSPFTRYTRGGANITRPSKPVDANTQRLCLPPLFRGPGHMSRGQIVRQA
ncbi:hypothetical protein LshimejAT787_0106960 [Lyophyllum shimeji]|uniref:Uncharacterized protein n=1 Tax=Lyophyllum shimeji TaxID=47721 RepID=A0A9P3PE53_LYOSH|nr:hypothetical protein LshimejAT787_0106960 [Lyophyllum shimeji]